MQPKEENVVCNSSWIVGLRIPHTCTHPEQAAAWTATWAAVWAEKDPTIRTSHFSANSGRTAHATRLRDLSWVQKHTLTLNLDTFTESKYNNCVCYLYYKCVFSHKFGFLQLFLNTSWKPQYINTVFVFTKHISWELCVWVHLSEACCPQNLTHIVNAVQIRSYSYTCEHV